MSRAAWAVLAIGIAGCTPSRFVLDVATEGGAAIETGPDGADTMEDITSVDGAEASADEGATDAAPDAPGSDAGIDAAIEAGPDAAAMGDAFDAGGDAPGDVAADPVVDAGSDAGPEVGAEAGRDASAGPLVELVSVNAAGTRAGDGASTTGLHSVSDDGRYVVFSSRASDLVSPSIVFPSGPIELVYVRDLRERTTTLLSRRADLAGPVPNGASYEAAISGDGGTVVFVTRATNIDPGVAATPSAEEVRLYRWQRTTGALDLITVERDGTTPFSLDEGGVPILSRDGRHLFFSTRTRVDRPSPRPRGEFGVFHVDLSVPVAARSFSFVSVSTTGAPGESSLTSFCAPGDFPGGGANVGATAITGDGRFAVGNTNAQLLSPDDTDGCTDVYLFERGTNNTRRVSARAGGALSSTRSYWVDDASARVAIETMARLTGDDGNSVADVYLGPMDGTAWRLVSAPLPGRVNDGMSGFARADATGTRVLFASSSSALVPGDTNFASDLFVRDLGADTTTRVTTYADGSEIDYRCTSIASCSVRVIGELSRDGRSAFFSSSAPLAGTSDANSASDVYLRRLP